MARLGHRQPNLRYIGVRKPTVLQRAIAPGQINATSNVTGLVSMLRGVAPTTITATSAVNAGVSVGNPGPDQLTIDVYLAGRKRSGHVRLIPPRVVTAFVPATAPPVEQTVLRVALTDVRTRQDYRRRVVQHILRQPVGIQQPVLQPTADQLKLRVKIPQQPRRLPARIAFISPAIVNPVVLQREQITPKIRLQAIETRQEFVRRTVRTRRQLFPVPASVTPTPFAAASTVTAAVSVLNPVLPVVATASSSVTAGLTFIRAINAAINATSAVTANVSGGTGPSYRDWGGPPHTSSNYL